jgi:hypothetical protein
MVRNRRPQMGIGAGAEQGVESTAEPSALR